MGCKAAVQALQKADFLKAKVTQKCDLLNDSRAWTDQQQLQTIYHRVLVLDLEYALDKKVEQELWTIGFKNHITALQEQVRDKKNPHRSEAQALLAWCLEAASGFYLTLLQELCMAFDLDLPFRKRLNIYSQTKAWNCSEQLNPPQTSSCIYICQYCLVHLGDIARYRNQRKQAESFYKHAILLSPTSGQPYNQLALLQASQGDKLGAIYYYVRGIAVKNPFPATATNLANTLSLAIDKDDAITEVQTKLTVNEFIRMFVRVHGLLYTATDLAQAELGVKSLNATLTPLVATQSFTGHKLIQITAINLYALRHTVGATSSKTEELTEDENQVRKLVLDLLAGSLSAFLLPVYTLTHDSTLLEYYALPAIKLITYWLQNEPLVLEEIVFQSRLQIWPGLCKLLNNLRLQLKGFDEDKFKNMPLSEDRELHGFLPLVEPFNALDFKLEELEEYCESEKLIRAKRLIDFGIWLTTYEVNNMKLVVTKTNAEDHTNYFEPGCVQPDPTIKLLEEMKSFNVVEASQTQKVKGPEKRGGILKPQGSLEKSRKEQETALKDNSNKHVTASTVTISSNKLESTKLKRVSQNVALQSIFKKMEENKQVKFDMGTVEKEKAQKLDPKPLPLPNKQLPTPSYLNSTYSTNSPFTQNSKPLQSEPPQEYYKSAFQNFANVPFERNALQPPQFPKNDISINSNDLNTPSHGINFSIPPPQLYNKPPPPVQSMNQSFSNSMQRPLMNQHIPMPYQGLNQFSQSHDFNAWKHEERPASNWWPSTNSPLNANYPSRDYQINYPFANNVPYGGANMDYGNQQGLPSPNVVGRSWSNQSVGSSPGVVGFDSTNQGMSLRQTMLKETRNLTPIEHLNTNHETPDKLMQVPSSAQGYSLFNSNSWSPSLPGQFRNNESSSEGLIHNLRQQSLFSRQASLQQLLERQNQFKKGDS